MGGSSSKGDAGCGSCCGGLLRSSPQKPRRLLSVDKVTTHQEALGLSRPNEGRWQPTASPTSPAAIWTSPVPRVMVPSPAASRKLAGGSGAGAVDFDMVIADMDSDAGPRLNKGSGAGATSPKSADAAAGGCGGPARLAGSGWSQSGRQASTERRSKYEVEQLIASPGSLPKPMFPDERESAVRTVGPTATFEMLAQVPREMLEAQTHEAQDLRRSLVRGSTMVFTSAGYPGKRFIFERAAQLGIKSVIIDHPDSWSRGLVDEGIVAKFLPVDMSQSSQEVFEQSLELIKHLGEDGLTGAADGITTFVELSVPLAARLCEALGLPGLRPAAVDAARDKHRTRAALKAAGLPTPRNVLIREERDLAEAGRLVGFPAVLKPVSGAASLGVKKVESMADLQACYREVVGDLSSLVVASGALVKNDGSGAGVNATSVVDLTVLLEQYLDGKEVDVDIVMSGGEWRYASVTDNGPTKEPYFNETWAVCPSMLSVDEQRALKELSINSVKALGFTSGVFHVECKYTSTGAQLIEVNARMGGGPVREVNRLVWGVDLVEEAAFCALGVPARPANFKSPGTCVGYSFVNAKKSGTLKSTACFEKLLEQHGVLSSDPLMAPGEQVTGASDGLATWLCLLVAHAETSKKALEIVQRLEDSLEPEIE